MSVAINTLATQVITEFQGVNIPDLVAELTTNAPATTAVSQRVGILSVLCAMAARTNVMKRQGDFLSDAPTAQYISARFMLSGSINMTKLALLGHLLIHHIDITNASVDVARTVTAARRKLGVNSIWAGNVDNIAGSARRKAILRDYVQRFPATDVTNNNVLTAARLFQWIEDDDEIITIFDKMRITDTWESIDFKAVTVSVLVRIKS